MSNHSFTFWICDTPPQTLVEADTKLDKIAHIHLKTGTTRSFFTQFNLAFPIRRGSIQVGFIYVLKGFSFEHPSASKYFISSLAATNLDISHFYLDLLAGETRSHL